MTSEFIIRRAIKMSFPEILWRIAILSRDRLAKHIVSTETSRFCITGEGKSLLNFPLNIFNKHTVLKEADDICNGKITIMNNYINIVQQNINYHMDYILSIAVPILKYSKEIDYRNLGKADIKNIWELNRHLFLTVLALAFETSGSKVYLNSFEGYIEKWFLQNPYMRGVNWSSTLEVGIRLINWCFCYSILKKHVNNNLKNNWIDSIYKHCQFISLNFSRFSSANNHIIGESAALFIASIVMPEFKQSLHWREKAFKILKNECLKQNFEDGVNREQAMGYQQFVMDFLILAALTGKAAGVSFPEKYWTRLERMMEYLKASKSNRNWFSNFGDSDNAIVFDAGQKEYGVYRSLLNTGASIFDRKDFLQADFDMDTKTSVLLNIARLNPERRILNTKPSRTAFPYGGYYILGNNFDTSREEKLIFDCGSLGYLSIAAHGHADALSFVFFAGGYPVFTDSGTYSYHTCKAWRDYFRSTRAHNTLCIDRRDQSVNTGNFMWGKKAKTEILKYENMTGIIGRHYGYCSLKDRVIHQRSITYCKNKGLWTVSDFIACRTRHEAEILFHLHPCCTAQIHNNRTIVAFPEGEIDMQFPEDWELTLYKGNISPVLGWYSENYGEKSETGVLTLKKEISMDTKAEINFIVCFK